MEFRAGWQEIEEKSNFVWIQRNVFHSPVFHSFIVCIICITSGFRKRKKTSILFQKPDDNDGSRMEMRTSIITMEQNKKTRGATKKGEKYEYSCGNILDTFTKDYKQYNSAFL